MDFSGWEMPVQYRGVVSEHQAVRTEAGVFDVSHLGRFRVSGEGSTDLLRRLLCNDVTQIGAGQAQYTMLLNAEGGVEDDIIVWRWEEEEYWVLPNGANYGRVMGTFEDQAPTSVAVRGLQAETVFLAVQGPRAPDILEEVLGAAPGRFRLARLEFAGAPVWLAGTGYTGEKGGEVAVGVAEAPALFEAFTSLAEPCGLGARDTLRLEMGYPLWGEDLDSSISPLEADLEWVVAWDHDFVGRGALERQREEGVSKRRIGLVMKGRQIPRHGYQARASGAEGRVASGNYSPVLGKGIGLAYLSPPPDDELEELEVQVRERWVPATRQDPPFIER